MIIPTLVAVGHIGLFNAKLQAKNTCRYELVCKLRCSIITEIAL